MGSSIPGVIDHLLTLARSAAATAGGNVIVTDGWPASLGLRMFGVGADQPPTEPSGEQSTGTVGIVTMGQPGLQETFAVPCYIYDASGGTDQKACRDALFAIFDPFLESLRSDPSLGSRCLKAMVGDLSLTGPKSADEAENGRFALLSWSVACQNIF